MVICEKQSGGIIVKTQLMTILFFIFQALSYGVLPTLKHVIAKECKEVREEINLYGAFHVEFSKPKSLILYSKRSDAMKACRKALKPNLYCEVKVYFDEPSDLDDCPVGWYFRTTNNSDFDFSDPACRFYINGCSFND